MSLNSIRTLGSALPRPGGIDDAARGSLIAQAEDQYATLRAKCLENASPSLCNAVLPRNMIYAITRRGEGYTLPWWAWMLAGYLTARLIK